MKKPAVRTIFGCPGIWGAAGKDAARLNSSRKEVIYRAVIAEKSNRLSVFELSLNFVCEVVLGLTNRRIPCKCFSFWFVLAIVFVTGCEITSGLVIAEQTPSLSTVKSVEADIVKVDVVEADIVEADAAKTNVIERFKADSTVTLACKEVINGEFARAEEILNNAGQFSDPRLMRLAEITEKYRALEEGRKKSKKEAYEEQIAELEKISEDGIPEEPNKLSEVFLIVVRASELADEQQKEELLQKPFVLNLIAKADSKGHELQEQGEWIESYAHCYFWLNKLYEDNKEYKDTVDLLVKMASIETALKDNSCEKSVDRYKGVTPGMLARTIKALAISYVSDLNYKEMAQKGVESGLLLGKVLTTEGKELAYSVDASNVELWNKGLHKIQLHLDADMEIIRNNEFIAIFEEVLYLNSETIKLPMEVVVVQFSEAALEVLDPFTNLVWPWRVKDFQKNMTQDFTGIGIHISKVRGKLTVASLLPGTPAYSSGLDANDNIIAVDGEKTDEMTLTCVVSKITGPKDTPVTLTVKHEGDPNGVTEDITIVRARIIVPTIRGWKRDSKSTTDAGINSDGGKWGHMVDPVNRIGYVRLTGFTDTTAHDMETQLLGLEERGMQGLIIDLRGNSGGYLATAAAVVDMFVEKGLIVKSQPKWGIANHEFARKKGTHPDYPLVILINEGSASASEIVAGALQDVKYKRATLVGTRTYGKGSVQTIVPYSGEGSQLKYTMAYYHLPSDQRVKNRYVMKKKGRKDWGIAPDVEVKMTMEEITKRAEVQWSNDILVKADHDAKAKPVKRYSAEDTLEADPQLQVGMLVLQTKIIQGGGEIVLAASKDKPKQKTVGKKTDS